MSNELGLRVVRVCLILYGVLVPALTLAQDSKNEGVSIETDFRYTKSADDVQRAKVVGGTPVPQNAFVNVVGISRAGKKEIDCTGTLVEPDLVVTAAHCVCDGINGQVMFGAKENAGDYVQVHASAFHLASCQDSLSTGRDIAILLLENAASYAPAAISDDALVDHASSYRVVGFGLDDKGIYGEKRETAVPTATNNCSGHIPPSGKNDADAYGCAPGLEIVAGMPGLGRDTCNGDSGGPLFVGANGTGLSGEAVYVLAGVTSRATKGFENKCGDGGIYVRLTAEARNWIQSTAISLRQR